MDRYFFGLVFKTREQESFEEKEWLVLEQQQRTNSTDIENNAKKFTPIDPKQFYGDTSQEWRQQLALLTKPIEQTNNSSFLHEFGRVFSRQEEAFKFIDLECNRALDLRPFAFEKVFYYSISFNLFPIRNMN